MVSTGFVLKPLSPQSFTGQFEVAAGKVYTIGRSRSCDLVFKDGRVSRKHCKVFLDSSSSCLVLYHGQQHDSRTERLGSKRKHLDNEEDLQLVKTTTVIVNGEGIDIGTSKVIQSGAIVQLVAPVKSLPIIGFIVEANDGVRSSLKELNVNHGALTCQGHIKRVKVSIDKLIQESRRLRTECSPSSVISRLTKNSTCIQTESKTSKVELKTTTSEGVVCGAVTEVEKSKNVQSSGLLLNQLEEMETNVSLKQLLEPIEDIEALFVATFTSDNLWFLSSTCLPKTLSVTIVCHDNERCWSTSRLEHPYPEWPNLRLIYPPFPVLQKMRGVGCHHPKFFLIRRSSNIRVIVTSANLNYRQWRQASNTVWWQDFPVQTTKDYDALFFPKSCDVASTTGDFAVQLAAFVSCLVKDVPTEAHWVVDLASYDFSKAVVSLVTSIPGFHESPFCQVQLSDKRCFGTVLTSVVGISYRFHRRFDPSGARLRRLATLLNGVAHDSEGMIQVLLRRVRDLSVDPNAISVNATLRPNQVRFLEQVSAQDSGEEMQIGFLPKRTAAWVASLCDAGAFTFRAMLWPKQMVAVAAGQSKCVVQLVLHVYEGPTFPELPSKVLKIEEMSALSNLLRLLQRNYGLWRLQEILSKQKWPDSEQKEFVFCSSSVGTSLNSKFLAAFSAAAGRKAMADDDSYESDPEWGRWTAQHEQAKPSIKVLFPSVECLRTAKWGPSSYRGILHFPERTWERLKTTGLLHHAIPSSQSRIGVPMHLKVALRRFEDKSSKRSYGWIYAGSHNFSPAAWGKCVNKSVDKVAEEMLQRSSTRLHICNYELGIVFMEPQQSAQGSGNRFEDFHFPLRLPAPKYSSTDRPATGSAIYKLLKELGEDEKSVLNEAGEQDSELPSEVEIEVQDPEDDDACSSGTYVEALWKQATVV